jgi:hypothetical protein
MPRVIVIPVVGIVLLLAAASLTAQIVLPGLAERRVAHRLETGGGTAHVSMSAFPAVRLLFGDGDSLRVKGRRLRLKVGHNRRLLHKLDGFDTVTVRLRDTHVGPLQLRSFVLDRPDNQKDYSVRLNGKTSPRALAAFLGGQAGGALGGELGDLAGSLLGGPLPLPLDLRARVHSRDGQPEVEDTSATVAGFPAGPLVQLALDAVLPRI